MPYLLPDLGLLAFGPLWSALTMLALVFGIWFYARQILTTNLIAAMFCALYLATNYLFILGFFSFQWGVAFAFVALGALEAWRKNHKPVWFAIYTFACVACYGSHLAAFAILGAICLLKRQFVALLPFAALTIYHVLLVPSHPEVFGGALNHNTVADKFGHFIEALFVRQNYVLDRCLLALFWGILILALWPSEPRPAGAVTRPLITTCALAALIYFVLPIGIGAIFYLDERALPFFYVPLLILALRVSESSRLIPALCAILAIANLGSLALFLPRQNREVAEYRAALQTIPERKTVLPIYTRQRDGSTYPLRHAASFYVADRHGYIPYLFSQVNGGGPSGYFLDHSTIYRPPQNWYMTDASPDWEKVAKTYDYVVITKPWDPARIDVKHLTLHYENEMATVFRVR
jgi:hypothetical protein